MKKNKLGNILLVIFAFFVGATGMYLLVNYSPKSVQTIVNKSEKEVTVTDTGIADAVEKIYDAVVVVGGYTNGVLSSSGTGFVYEQDEKFAYILTNSHVVDGTTSVKVKFTNDSIEDVELVGNDIYSDIAVLKIKKEKIISVAEIGNTDSLRVGDTVFAIGAPLDDEYSWTVTRGILSGKDRLVDISTTASKNADWVMSVMQTDAAINSGNSGGPLANSNGQVIGITNMKLVSDGVEGIGFAIPIEDALKVAETLEKEGKFTRPYVGIEMLDLSNPYSLWQAGILIPEGVEEGVVVYNIVNDSPADVAGLKKGDIIIKLGKREITGLADFRYELYKYSPKDEVEVVFVRDGEKQTTTVILGNGE